MNAHNFTDSYLADEIGAQDAIAKEAGARLNALKDEAKRRGLEAASGSHYRIAITTSERHTLDVKGLRALLGDALTPYERTSTTSTLRISSLFQQPVLED